jgi:hypothetical protein
MGTSLRRLDILDFFPGRSRPRVFVAVLYRGSEGESFQRRRFGSSPECPDGWLNPGTFQCFVAGPRSRRGPDGAPEVQTGGWDRGSDSWLARVGKRSRTGGPPAVSLACRATRWFDGGYAPRGWGLRADALAGERRGWHGVAVGQGGRQRPRVLPGGRGGRLRGVRLVHGQPAADPAGGRDAPGP